MGNDSEMLRAIYSKWTDEDLIKALAIDKDNYEPNAIEMMNNEVQKRKIKVEDINNFQKDYMKEEEVLVSSGQLYCPKCHSLNIRQERRLWHLLIIPLIGYFLLPKYQCLECGLNFRNRR
jgi:hypothetical protein